MTDSQARDLAKTIAKSSNGVSIKFGKTNGLVCLHLINRTERRSQTIYDPREWAAHDWNDVFQREYRKQTERIVEKAAA